MTSTREINEPKSKKILKKIISLTGYKITKIDNFNDKYNDFIAECSANEKKDIDNAVKISVTSRANLWSIIQSLKYISNNNIAGDIVECGVFRGGSLAIITKYVEKYSLKSKIFGFDTFEEGFLNAKLTKYDLTIKKKKLKLSSDNIDNFHPTIDSVKKNIYHFTNKLPKNLKLIKGDVMNTLKKKENIPKKISFLRLDTDLYITTKKELEILYPKLVKGGILHIDDYGMFPGVRKAVDEYFINKKIWLHRVDLTCRLMIK